MELNKNTLEKVWFPTKEEINNFIKRFGKQLILSQQTINIIMKHYNRVIQKIKDYPILKHTISWLGILERDLQNNNINISRQTIYKFMSENNLISPQKYVKILNDRDSESGWEIAKKHSKKTEDNILRILQEKYPSENIVYHQWIFYKLKNSPTIYHKIPDFMITHMNESYLDVIDAKEYCISQFDKKAIKQLTDYKTLLEFMFPLKQINASFYSKNYDEETYEKTYLEDVKDDSNT